MQKAAGPAAARYPVAVTQPLGWPSQRRVDMSEIDEAPLQQFVGMLVMISSCGSAAKRLAILDQFWNRYGCKVGPGQRHCPDFRILRLMCPELDRERSAYNLKEASIAKFYIEINNLDKVKNTASSRLPIMGPHTIKRWRLPHPSPPLRQLLPRTEPLMPSS